MVVLDTSEWRRNNRWSHMRLWTRREYGIWSNHKQGYVCYTPWNKKKLAKQKKTPSQHIPSTISPIYTLEDWHGTYKWAIWKGTIIWTKPPWLCSMLIFRCIMFQSLVIHRSPNFTKELSVEFRVVQLQICCRPGGREDGKIPSPLGVRNLVLVGWCNEHRCLFLCVI